MSVADPFEAFVAALPAGRQRELGTEPARMRALYMQIWETARRAWPDVEVSPSELAQWLADRLPDGSPTDVGLRALRTEDLYLACACASGRPEALVAFEERYFLEVPLAVKRVARANLHVDDVTQLVRERLFVGDATHGPRISAYRGTGAVRAWLRVTVSRIVLNAAMRGPREALHDEESLVDLAVEGESSELSLIKVKYRAEFRAAVQVALAALDAESRSLLTHAFAQGLTVDRIGAIYGIHRATAARRLQRAREAFAEETRRALAHRLGGATADEVESIIGLIRSQFDVTLGGFLRGAQED